ncbi:MAG: hypothetical protein B7Z08_01405 [Sphingomonadales bacterium 32-68-7]|nr:MAG: hypothetical protein B7Z33_08740 [Sphingomonadales bacterium 12-68-11]OYX10374.1 MAG: hypothetical protein B7Z08_01405 [Sphingomonadales bacterium 32-68-7]
MRDGERSDDLALDLLQVGTGDRAAFRRVYQATAGKLLFVCQQVTRDRSAAEDVLQDVYVKVWRSAASYDAVRAHPMTWLGTIARNSAIDWYRARAKRVALTSADTLVLSDEPEPVEQRMIREQSEESALASIGDLSASEEAEVRTIYLQGLTYSQAAEQAGVPLATLKSRVRRSLAKLRQKLDDA